MIEVKSKTVYITQDSKQFEVKEDAIYHEACLILWRWAKEAQLDCVDLTINLVVHAMVDHAEMLFPVIAALAPKAANKFGNSYK